MQFGKIKDLREDNDLTQVEIANFLNVKRSTYAMWELGDVNFPIENIVKLAKLFHTNVEYMLGLTQNKNDAIYIDNIDLKFIGNQLRRYRLKLNKTQREFATYLGIRQSSYSYYEDGKSRIPTINLIDLCEKYKLPLNRICGCQIKEDQKNEVRN